MLAYHGKQEVKDLWVARAVDDRRKDRFRQGHWVFEYCTINLNDFKGCHIGCLARYTGCSTAMEDTLAGKFEALEDALGIPHVLLDFFEFLFEKLPSSQSDLLTESVLDVIPVGADLSLVEYKLVYEIVNYIQKYDPDFKLKSELGCSRLRTSVYEAIEFFCSIEGFKYFLQYLVRCLLIELSSCSPGVRNEELELHEIEPKDIPVEELCSVSV